MNTVFVGYDRREPEAFDVCKASIERHSTMPLAIRALREPDLRDAGFYRRKFVTSPGGQRFDRIDGKPFSTDFSFTRFLVPALSLFDGWSLFCDSDFLFTAPLDRLFAHCDDRYAVCCVQHQHEPTEAVKMDGVAQVRYRRKNWSSLVLWNNAHPSNRHMSLACVNKMPGGWLHAFEWLKDGEIGALPATWNFLVGYNRARKGEVPCGIHFTDGIPTMPGYEDSPFADLWRAERDSRRSRGNGTLQSERSRARISTESTDGKHEAHA